MSAVNAWKNKESRERKRQRLGRIRLRSPWFRAVWIAFFILRVVLFVYLAGLTIAYWFMSTVIFSGTRNQYNLPGPMAMLATCGLIGVGAAVCGFQLVQMIRLSIKQRRLTFRPRQSEQPSREAEASSAHVSLARSMWLRAQKFYRCVLGPSGLLGIEHPYFFQVLVLRELVEIVLQGYQAYTTSTHVPRRWMNHFVTVLLVLNCWSTLLVHLFGPKSLAVQRVICLAVDIVLDFTWTVVVPACLVLPYVLVYDPEIGSLPEHLQADMVWSLSWEMEIQQLCVTSLMDLLSSMMPSASMLMSSRTITGLIDEKRTLILPHEHASPPSLSKQEALKDIGGAYESLVPARRIFQVAPCASAVPATSHACSRTESNSRATRTRTAFKRRRAHMGIDSHFVLFFLLGVGVISVHVYAILVAKQLNLDVGCLVQMRPWFTHQYSCAFANIDFSVNRTGDRIDPDHRVKSEEDEFAERLAAFHPSTLRYLRVSHATALKMPAILSWYSSLHLVEIVNSTIAEWPITAALSTDTHPGLRRLSLVRTNMSALPDALARDAPFVFVDLIATNLTMLPDSVSSNWPAVRYICMEHGLLRELPRAVAAIPSLERLSVCDNQIESLPSALPNAYAILNVARNPLRALPETLGDTSQLRLLTFEYTQVAVVPAWATAAKRSRGAKLTVYGRNSPFCEQEEENAASSASSPSAAPAVVTCATASRRANGHFLLANVSFFV